MLKIGFAVASLVAVAVAVLPVNSQAAQTTKTNAGQSYYCATGSALMMMDDNEDTLRKIYETCKPGDTIGLAQGSVNVQRLCDFTKTIQLANRVTVCVLAPLRPTR